MSETYPNLIQTNFPDEIDKKYNMQDVSDANISRVQIYESLIGAGNVSGAQQYLRENPDLIPICFNADKWNRHEHMIIALESFFKNEVQDYILNVVQYKSTYDPDLVYKKYNVVNYTYNAVTQYYMALKRVPSGEENNPEGANKTEYWMPLAIKGERGESGVGLTYMGLWDQTIVYGEDECVSRGNSLWRSLINNNTANDPSTDDGTRWEQVFNVSTYATSVRFSDNTTLQAWRNTSDVKMDNAIDNISDLKKSNLTAYISPTGSNSNDGLTNETPMLNYNGVVSKYRNLNQLTLKLMDGTYTEHFIVSNVPSVTITSESRDKTDVIMTGGFEFVNTTVNLYGITIDGSSYNGTPVSFKRAIGTMTDCAVIGSNSRSCVKTFTSRLTIDGCSLSNSTYAVRAEDASDVLVENCYGSGISTAYYALSGSVIDYDNTNEITSTNVSDSDSGTIKSNSVLSIKNGGTGAASAYDAKVNLEATFRTIKSVIGGNGNSASLTPEQVETINHFSVFSIVVNKPNNGSTINYNLLGKRLGGNIIYFNGYDKGYMFDAVLSVTSGILDVELHAYNVAYPTTDVATAENFTIAYLYGHV